MTGMTAATQETVAPWGANNWLTVGLAAFAVARLTRRSERRVPPGVEAGTPTTETSDPGPRNRLESGRASLADLTHTSGTFRMVLVFLSGGVGWLAAECARAEQNEPTSLDASD